MDKWNNFAEKFDRISELDKRAEVNVALFIFKPYISGKY